MITISDGGAVTVFVVCVWFCAGALLALIAGDVARDRLREYVGRHRRSDLVALPAGGRVMLALPAGPWQVRAVSTPVPVPARRDDNGEVVEVVPLRRELTVDLTGEIAALVGAR